MRPQIAQFFSALATAAGLAGCQGVSQIESIPALPCAAAAPAAGDAGGEGQVTFFGDVLPIFASTTKGRSYKCTTCHAHYAQPDGAASVDELERIVDSLEAGRMPRGGDPVRDADIAVLRKWRLQGFQTGTATTGGSASGRSSGAGC